MKVEHEETTPQGHHRRSSYELSLEEAAAVFGTALASKAPDYSRPLYSHADLYVQQQATLAPAPEHYALPPAPSVHQTHPMMDSPIAPTYPRQITQADYLDYQQQTQGAIVPSYPHALPPAPQPTFIQPDPTVIQLPTTVTADAPIVQTTGWGDRVKSLPFIQKLLTQGHGKEVKAGTIVGGAINVFLLVVILVSLGPTRDLITKHVPGGKSFVEGTFSLIDGIRGTRTPPTAPTKPQEQKKAV